MKKLNHIRRLTTVFLNVAARATKQRPANALMLALAMGLLFIAGDACGNSMVMDRYTFESTSTTNVTFSGSWSTYQGPMYTGTAYTKSTTATGATATYRPFFTGPQQATVMIYRFVEVAGQYPFVPYTGNDSNVQVTIIHAGITNTVSMNSAIGQTGYWSAGSYNFLGTTNEAVIIQRTSTGTGNASKAGLVRFDLALDTMTTNKTAPVVPVGYSESGAWQTTNWVGYSSYAQPRWTSVQGATACWNPGPLAAQTMRVAFFVPAQTNSVLITTNGSYTIMLLGNTRTDQPITWNTTTNGALKFQIFHNGKVDTIYCDTSSNAPTGWYTLGNWDFSGTNAEYVTCTRMTPSGTGAGTVVDSVSFDDIRFGGPLIRSVIVTPLTNSGPITIDPRFLDEVAFDTKLAAAQTPAGYTETGTWGYSSLPAATLWSRGRYAGVAGNKATWNPLITELGTYQVSAACMYTSGDASSPRNYQVVSSGITNQATVNLTPYVQPGAFSLFWVPVGSPGSFSGTNEEYCRIVTGSGTTRSDAVTFTKAVGGGAILKVIQVSTYPVFPMPQFSDATQVPKTTVLAMEFVVQSKLMSGTSPTTFGPAVPTTLGDYLAGLTKLLGLAGDPLMTAQTNGLLNNWPGITNAIATNAISREAALVIAQDAVRYSGGQFNITNLAGATTNYADYNTVSSWAQEACGRALGWQLASLNISGNLNPQANLNRSDLALLLYNITVQCLQASPPVSNAWALTFNDEFNGIQMDWNNWGFANWDGANGAVGGRWPENAEATNGMLVLHNWKENRRGLPYTAGGLITRSYTPTNGYCECRLRLAQSGAQHTSWWGRKDVQNAAYTNRFLEIDSPEAEYPNIVSQHAAYVPGFQWNTSTAYDISHDFHIYAWAWDTNGASFFIDGVMISQNVWSAVPGYPYYSPLNIGLSLFITGGIFGSLASVNIETMDGSEVDVDWVRVYQKVGATRQNTPPSVALTSPLNNAVVASSNVTLAASATDADGTVSRVEYYGNGTLVGSNNYAPFSCVWNNLTNGTYSAYAIAYDNGGNATTSAPVSFTVSVSPRSVSPPPTLTLSNENGGNLQLQVAGATGFNYTLQASTNLQTWTNMLTTNPAVMPFLWTESNRMLFPTRFYRVIIGP